MSKKVKMVLYGEPGAGKSTFFKKAPNPLYICTDGNFEWLGMPDKNHVRVSSWDQAKKVFKDIVSGTKYNEFDTIVVDLLESLYVWADMEFCEAKKIEHIGDYKSMGAGYAVVRKEFFAEVSKLLSVDKNVGLISHGVIKVEQTRMGAERYKFYPSDKISIEKQWDDIEGQVRYFLRAYVKPEESNGRVIKKHYLSLIPKENEYGIARGLDEANTPEDIELDWDVFASVIGLDSEPKAPAQEAPAPAAKPQAPKPAPKAAPVSAPAKPAPAPAPAPKIPEAPLPSEEEAIDATIDVAGGDSPAIEVQPEPVAPAPAPAPKPAPAPAPAPAPTPAPATAAPAEGKQLTQAEKIAQIKAKLAAMKK